MTGELTSQPPGTWYSQLNASWAVPPAPLAAYAGGNQIYYTFPGLESNEFIIQPVIQYAQPNGGWAMASWHCNSGSNCIHSDYQTIAAGDAMYGTVAASNCANGSCTWTITTLDVTTDVRTVLAVVDTENYWWAAGGAVEVYNLNSCDQYPANGVFYSGISLFDNSYNQVSPSWNAFVQGTDPSCGFSVTSTGTSVNLNHNPASVTASGGLTADAGTCQYGLPCPAWIMSLTASGNTITVTDNGGHTATITLSGATASGGLTAHDNGCFFGCPPPPGIRSITASGSNAITVDDTYGHTGTITLSGATASNGLVACHPGFGGSCDVASYITAVTASSGANGFSLADNGGHPGYVRLDGP